MGTKRTSARVGALGLTGLLIGACSSHRAHDAADAQAMMVGVANERLLACMGPPGTAAMAGSTEVWTCDSGNGRADTFVTATFVTATFVTAAAIGGRTVVGSDASTSRLCRVDIAMNGGSVARLNHGGPTGGLITRGEQCAYAVDDCVRQTATLASAPAPQSPAPQSSTPPPTGAPGARGADITLSPDIKSSLGTDQ